MIVLGHSQGGLLTKLTAIDSGDTFWANVSRVPFDEVQLPPEDKELLRKAMFVKPLPFVSEVIFLATPQRGSYLAGPQLVRRLASYFVRLPSKQLVSWQQEAGYDGWNLYRGDLALLRSSGEYTQADGSNAIAEILCGLTQNWIDDPAAPAPGSAAFYLITGVNAAGESGLGTDSAGVPRPNTHACP